MKQSPAILTALLAALVVAGCGGSASPASSPATSGSSGSSAATVQVATKNVPGLGQVLVNDKGLTLYSFVPDKHSKVTCVGACAAVWPPLMAASGQKPVATGLAKSSLLGSDPDPSGGQVVTYNGWPLYTYVTDTSPGQAKGQALNLNGGLWYVLSPSGAVVHAKPASSGGSGY
jgi:predicted lipoprotein with Yx(FWY)xxD motif